MRWLALVCLGGVASAGPKHSPDKYAAAASAEFDKALAEEHRDRLQEALDHYKNAFEISPHADVVFNEASVLERMDHDHEAIAAYELYLVLAPDAPDRSQVEAAIQRIATKSRTFDLHSNLELADAYVLVDGEVVAKPGQIKDHTTKVTIGQGQHFVAVVTAISFAGEELTAHSTIHDRSGKVFLSGKPRIDGNVVVEMPYMYHGRIDGKVVSESQRVAVTPGMQVLALRDDKHECPPIKVEAREGDVAFVQLLEDELPMIGQNESDQGRCRRLTVKQQHLVFAK
jgi:tetratricopeptide (TPR) repeat protein